MGDIFFSHRFTGSINRKIIVYRDFDIHLKKEKVQDDLRIAGDPVNSLSRSTRTEKEQ